MPYYVVLTVDIDYCLAPYHIKQLLFLWTHLSYRPCPNWCSVRGLLCRHRRLTQWTNWFKWCPLICSMLLIVGQNNLVMSSSWERVMDFVLCERALSFFMDKLLPRQRLAISMVSRIRVYVHWLAFSCKTLYVLPLWGIYRHTYIRIQCNYGTLHLVSVLLAVSFQHGWGRNDDSLKTTWRHCLTLSIRHCLKSSIRWRRSRQCSLVSLVDKNEALPRFSFSCNA